MTNLIIVPVVMILYSFAITLLLTFLSVYHGLLVVANETTQEEIRNKYSTWGGNPYNMGSWSRKNFKYFWRT